MLVFHDFSFSPIPIIIFRKSPGKNLNERMLTGLVRARHVSPTPADLGGVTSFLYELELSCKHSFIAYTI